MTLPPDVEKPKVYSSTKYSPPSSSTHDGKFGCVKVAQRIGISMDGVCAALKSTTSSTGAVPSRVHGTRLRTFLSDIVAVEPENRECAEGHSGESSAADNQPSLESSSATPDISQDVVTENAVTGVDSNTPMDLVAESTVTAVNAHDNPVGDNHFNGNDSLPAPTNEGEAAMTGKEAPGLSSSNDSPATTGTALSSHPTTLLPFAVPAPGLEASTAAASVAAGCLI